MKAPYERQDAELIADLQEEAALLRQRNFILELELKDLRRDLRRARRNRGYRIVNGIARALRRIRGVLLRDGPVVHFPRPRHAHSSAAVSCSAQLRTLLETLSVQTVFFTSSTELNWAVRKLLAGRANQWCLSPDELKLCMTSFFAVPQKHPQSNKEPPTFAHYDLVVIDSNDAGILWPLLKGRFWPHQKIVFHGNPRAVEFPATQSGPDFLFYAAPPLPWLDPRHAYLPQFAPWKSAHRRLPLKLPSGKPWPKISVVTPSYNQGKFITDTFDSVFGQNYPNLEYLVLDGGSTDETSAILDRYRPRLTYSCSQKDNGQADAINQGFARATGDILAWLNSDDQYAPDALMHVAVAFETFPEADIVVGGCGLLQGAPVPKRIHHSALPFGKVIPLPLSQLLDLDNCWLKGHFFYQPEVFFCRRIWEAVGAHVADDLYYCFDYDLWVRMAQAGAKVVHIPDLLALYRVHPEQKTYGNNLPYLPELKLVKSRRDPSVARHDTLAKA